MGLRVDLNCDLGESFGRYRVGADEAVIPLITSANIACGFHAGDPTVMRRTVRLAHQHGVSIGAHPGLRDLVGFGRRELQAAPEELYGDVLYQIGALAAVCRAEGSHMRHVKPHGALYHMAGRDPSVAKAIAAAIRDFDPGLALFALPGSELMRAGVAAGLHVALEVFGDRAYGEDGRLVPREQPEAILADVEAAEAQVVQMVLEGTVTGVNGTVIPVQADTVCVHGDNPQAVAFIRRIRQRLAAAGVALAPPSWP